MNLKYQLLWSRPWYGGYYYIGYLEFSDGKYIFHYDNRYKNGIECASKRSFPAFKLFPRFKDLEKKYKSKKLFKYFEDLIKKYIEAGNTQNLIKTPNLNVEETFYFLKKALDHFCNITLVISPDSFDYDFTEIEFESPLLFYNKYRKCSYANDDPDDRCMKFKDHPWIGDEIYLTRDINNKYDENAIIAKDHEDNILGYIPKYYTKFLAKYIDDEKYIVKSIFNKLKENPPCFACVGIKINIRKIQLKDIPEKYDFRTNNLWDEIII